MLTPTETIVRIEEGHRQTRLSPAQKKFNATIKKIDKQKQLLAIWQETIPRYQQLVAEKFTPLRQAFGKHQAEMVHLLDGHHGDKRFTRHQKKKIGHLIRELCAELINAHDWEDLKPVYNKYSEFDFDAEDQEATALAGDFIKSLLEYELGIDMDDEDIDVNSPEKIAAFVQEKLEERERQANDLLQLLELQLAVEQIDQSKINTIAEDRLKYYNKILQGQLEQLMLEVEEIEFMFRQQAGLAPYDALSPKRLLQLLHEDIERLHEEIARVQHDLIAFQDVDRLRGWLKEYRIPVGRGEMMGEVDKLFFGDDLPPFGFR
jgi:hypothetical protein